MAEKSTCPVCDAPNDPADDICEACGADLGHQPAAIRDDAADAEDGSLAEVPADDYAMAENTAAEEADYELEVIETADSADPELSDDPEVSADEPLEGDEPSGDPADAESTDGAWDEDDVIADGGARLDGPSTDAEIAQTDVPLDEVSSETPQVEADANEDALPDQTEQSGADGQADEHRPEELDEILHPVGVARRPIEPLPTPGPPTHPATLTAFKAGQQVGAPVTVEAGCTVLGLASDDPKTDDAEDAEDAEDWYELEAIEPSEANDGEVPADDPFEPEPVDDAPQMGSADSDLNTVDSAVEQQPPDDEIDTPVDSDEPDKSVADDTPSADAAEDPNRIQQGPVVDLGEFGDLDHFAGRHGYLFCQNKHVTLYVLSDKGTQLNDEMIELGEHRELVDGDVIVVGGEVAFWFDFPAA